jgi:hypothetical protein
MSTKQMSFEEALRLVQQARLGSTYYDPTLRRALDMVVKNPEKQPDDRELARDRATESRGRRQ